VRSEIEQALRSIPTGADVEIAYFGGSFTAMEPTQMHTLLALAQEYVDAGRACGIRFSTRPDAVEDVLLDSLAPYSISCIELGLQSLDDCVLEAVQRGHTAAVAEDACRRIVARGYRLGGQMMVGLPCSTPESELRTARRICALGAREVRIYPTVVFEGTALGELLHRGDYTPLTVEVAVGRCAPLLDVFEECNVLVLRIGLCESEGLQGDHVIGGAHHPALGELIRSEQYLRRVRCLLQQNPPKSGARVTVTVAPGRASQMIGQHRCNAEQLCREFQLTRISVREDAALSGAQITISTQEVL
jgi:histone acetyltransferase (RNA polymerase elongator complex component)